MLMLKWLLSFEVSWVAGYLNLKLSHVMISAHPSINTYAIVLKVK
jgi:hypothetical protein